MTEHLEAVVERALIKRHHGKEQDVRSALAPYAPPGRKRKLPNGAR
jgi:hypothetical protein